MWRDVTLTEFSPRRRKEARDKTPCVTQPDLLQTLCLADRAASTVMGHVEPVREELVIGIFTQ